MNNTELCLNFCSENLELKISQKGFFESDTFTEVKIPLEHLRKFTSGLFQIHYQWEKQVAQISTQSKDKVFKHLLEDVYFNEEHYIQLDEAISNTRKYKFDRLGIYDMYDAQPLTSLGNKVVVIPFYFVVELINTIIKGENKNIELKV